MKRLPPPSWQRVVVLAVHPDDESLSSAGLIQHALGRGADVRVIFITDGDNNPWPQRYMERRWHIDATARARWGKRRRGEAVAALASLGVSRENISFWHYPDQGLTPLLLAGGEELIARLSHEIIRWQPTLLVAPSMRDLHPDHSAFALLLHFALERNAFFPAWSFALLEYLVHTREAESPGGSFQISLSSEQVARKRQAILRHATQMALSRDRFLAFAQPSEIFLTPDSAFPFDHNHPVLAADFTDGCVGLKIRRLASPTTILLAAESATRAVRQSIKLSAGAEPVVCDAISGEFQTDVRVVRARDYDEIFLPADFFASEPKLFVKVITGRGFYDRTGWRLVSPKLVFSATEDAMSCRGVEPRVCCIIPCYNLAGICGPIVRAAAGFADAVIAVNDGSTDETERVLREVAGICEGKVQVLSLPHNCGKGVALLEAFRRAANTVPFDVLVTLDGDGQHRPEDIPRLARTAAVEDCDLVIGERLARVKMPLRSRLGNTLTAGLMKFFHPAAPTDTQSGFRAFQRDFVREILGTIEGGRYETELEILLLALQQGRRIGSVSIPTVYLDGNRLSHFRPLIDSWRIYRTLFRWQLNPAGNREAKASLIKG